MGVFEHGRTVYFKTFVCILQSTYLGTLSVPLWKLIMKVSSYNAGKNHNVMVANKSVRNVAKFKYLVVVVEPN
jgi:hypothetical protein